MGVVIEVIPETPEGDIDLQALQALLLSDAAGRPPPVLVCVTHVPTSSGALVLWHPDLGQQRACCCCCKREF